MVSGRYWGILRLRRRQSCETMDEYGGGGGGGEIDSTKAAWMCLDSTMAEKNGPVLNLQVGKI